MTDVETRYAKSGDLYIAYQTVGEGALDLVIVPGFVWHLEHQWEWPEYAAMVRRLASFSRIILFDKRGTGLSDRVPPGEMPTLEQRMDDLRAVLDACGSERASLLGFWEGGPMCALFAATHPRRTRALVLYGAPAAFTKAPGYPWAPDAETNETDRASIRRHVGPGAASLHPRPERRRRRANRALVRAARTARSQPRRGDRALADERGDRRP